MPRRTKSGNLLPPNAKSIKKAIHNVSAAGGNKEFRIEGHRGIVLLVTASGAATWYLHYDRKEGRLRRRRKKKIGRHDEMSLGEVIFEADSLRLQAKNGEDPASKPAGSLGLSGAHTFGEAFLLWLNHKQDKRQITRDGDEALYRRHVEAWIGHVLLEELEASMITANLEVIRKATTDRSKGHRGLQATKARALIHAVLEFATKKKFVSQNVVRQVEIPVPKINPGGKASRPLTEYELRRVWTEADRFLSPQVARALRLALLLGRRVSEVTGAAKSEVRIDEHRWFIPVRTGNKSRYPSLVPLSSYAAELFAEAMHASGSSEYVFASRPGDGSMSRHTPSQAFTEYRRLLGIVDKVPFHNARTLVNDHMSQMRVPAEYRSHVLHHTGDIKQRLADNTYSTYDFEDEKKQALELWEARLFEIVAGDEPSGLRWDHHWRPKLSGWNGTRTVNSDRGLTHPNG